MTSGQAVSLPGGKDYGTGKALQQAQQIAPVPSRRAPLPAPAPGSPPGGVGGGAPPMVDIGSILGRMTNNPKEPVTAGLAVGAGPGPEAISEPTEDDAYSLRRLALMAEGPDMPPQMRGLGFIARLIDDARVSRQQMVPGVTMDDVTEGLT